MQSLQWLNGKSPLGEGALPVYSCTQWGYPQIVDS
jgi:hypothetical protein